MAHHYAEVQSEAGVRGCTGSTTVAADSGSGVQVADPDDVPEGTVVRANKEDKQFVGANNSRIENYGTCTTTIRGKTSKGNVDALCNWALAEVSRPLHSVSRLCGPIDEAKQDVLFNNKKCVVVPPGIVDKILETHRPPTTVVKPM